MADGNAVVIKVTGTGALNTVTPRGGATVFPSGRIAQGILGAVTASGNAFRVVTGVQGTGSLTTISAVRIFEAIPFSGIQGTGQLGIVTAQGENFKNFLAPYIANQIPEYIRTQNPQFVTFIEAYYRFLDRAGQANDLLLNSSAWTDVDTTLDLFVDKLKAQFAWDFPSGAIIDARRFIKLVHEFYETKGTEDSIELFFRMMYDVNININYPGKTVLRASDGQWRRDVTLKLDTAGYSGNLTFVYFAEQYTVDHDGPNAYVLQVGNNSNPFDLIGKTVFIQFFETVPGSGILLRRIQTSILDVKKTANIMLYDITVDLDPNTTILDGAILVFDSLTYGELTRQLSSYRIIVPGIGFHEGDVIFVSELGASGPYFAGTYCDPTYVASNPENGGVMRVSSINSATGVVTATLINSGYRFQNNSFQIQLSGPASTTPTTVEFTTGFISQRPGYFLDSSGLLSDACKLQDNWYYQPYSYVIKSDVDPGTWLNVYKRTVHPAGVKLFSEFVISDNLNFRPSTSIRRRIVA